MFAKNQIITVRVNRKGLKDYARKLEKLLFRNGKPNEPLVESDIWDRVFWILEKSKHHGIFSYHIDDDDDEYLIHILDRFKIT